MRQSFKMICKVEWYSAWNGNDDMNFFALGYVFLVIHLNLGWASNYALKLVGMLFMLGGLSEISAFSGAFGDLKKQAYGVMAVSAASFVAILVLKLADIGGALFSIVSVVAGVVCAAAVMLFLYKLIRLLIVNNQLVNDVSNISRLYSGWQKLACFTAANILFDILNRALPAGLFADFAGVVVTITKIILFVFVISTGWTFNKIRCDFNDKHPDEGDE